MSRTNIDLDDNLIRRAMTMSSFRTKKDLVHAALEEFVRKIRRKSILKFMGSHCWKGNLDQLRRSR